MPIYEYKCDDCGNRFEKLVRTSDGPGLECPSCGQKRVSQQYSTFSAHANGAGSQQREAPACPGGMCSNPGICGMN